ncbi:MAG: type IV pilus twitching motility protein PilT [Candidatus Methylacidiphilales bacterium]
MDSETLDLVSLLALCAERGGSDLHLTVGAPPVIRLDGSLIPLDYPPLSSYLCRDLVLSALSEAQRARLERDWELDFVLDIQNVGRFRGNAHYVRGRTEATFRVIPAEIPSLEELGHRPTMKQICLLEEGLVLITGTTGSGKTTTLASMIKTIVAARACLVVSIEDPVEFILDNGIGIVKQREVGLDTKSFAASLKHVLRQDPDVIVISELRDLETMRAAITAAETGHLVIATLHTLDAPKAIDRIIDVFPPDQQSQITVQLSNCLRAVIAQRLLPRADGRGRVMATETLVATDAVRACIRERKTHMLVGIMEIGSAEGMNTLDVSLAELVQAGAISREEAILHARDAESIPEPVNQPGERKGWFGGRRR